MRLDLLVLIRLATNKSRPLPPSDLAKQLRPLAAIDDFKPRLDETIRTLAAGGWILTKPLRVTDSGRTRAAEALGVDVLPPWSQVRSRHLPALALGLPPAHLKNVQAAVIAQLLVRQLGLTPPRSSGPEQVIKIALAKVTGAPRAEARLLQAALVRRWVAAEPVLATATATAAAVSHADNGKPTPRIWSDDDLLAAVRDATVHVPTAGRFGGDRVFVSAIWRQLGEGAAFPGLTLDGLKQRLILANRNQQLTLARADLVGAMDPREVAASEIRYLNSTFHFVVDRSRA